MAARLNKWTIHKIDERIDRQRVATANKKSHDKNRKPTTTTKNCRHDNDHKKNK